MTALAASARVIRHDDCPPSRLVLLGVLLDAVEAHDAHMRARSPQGARAFAEAERWFASRDTDHPFTFERICDALHLDPDRVREVLARRRAEALAAAGTPAARAGGRRGRT